MDIEIQKLRKEIDKIKKTLAKFNEDDFSATKVFRKIIVLANQDTDPNVLQKGAIACVNGKLKIYDGSNWAVAGSQT